MKQYRSSLYKIATFVFMVMLSFTGHAQEVEWLSWDEAVKRAQTDEVPKKIFVDVYTDWCGWCKKMDRV